MHPLRKSITLLEQPLMELDWHDKIKASDVIKAHPGKWVHFSQINDLSINYGKSLHKDPKGIYFYPTEFFINSNERVKDGQQYGTNMPFYFIVDIDLNSPGITLSKITWEFIEQLAEKNGWLQYIQQYKEDPKQFNIPYYSKIEEPKFFFWHFVESLIEKKLTTWNKAYKGLAYIYDDNNAVIMNHEPHQLIVFDRHIIKNIQSFTNSQTKRLHDESDVYAFAKILRAIREKYNGVLTWKAKLPLLDFTIGDKKFKLTTEISSTWGSTVRLNYQYKRSEDSFSFKTRDISANDLVKSIDTQIEKLLRMKSDLLWQPIIQENQAKQLITKNFLSKTNLAFNTKIGNFDYTSMRVEGNLTKDIIETTLRLYIKKEDFSVTLNVFLFEKNLLTAGGNSLISFTDPNMDIMQDVIEEDFDNKLMTKMEWFHPDKEYSYYNPKFYSKEAWNSMIGYVLINCGLRFKNIYQKYAEQITAYHQYDDKEYLIQEIKRVMKI